MNDKPEKFKIRPKKGYYDEAWDLLEESENYFICRYPGLQKVDALPKKEFEIIYKEQKCLN